MFQQLTLSDSEESLPSLDWEPTTSVARTLGDDFEDQQSMESTPAVITNDVFTVPSSSEDNNSDIAILSPVKKSEVDKVNTVFTYLYWHEIIYFVL